MSTLMYERGSYGARLQPYLQAFHHPSHRTLAHHPARRAAPPAEGPLSSARSSRSAARKSKSCRFNQMRAIQPPSTATGVPGPEGSIQKIFWSELNQRLPANRSGAAGFLRPTAQAGRFPRCRQRNLVIRPIWRTRGNTIEAGTSEVQRNIIGHFVLGPAQKLLREKTMQFGLTESQEFLKKTAPRKFFAGECPSMEMRRLMQNGYRIRRHALVRSSPPRATTGIVFPEAYGGVGLGQSRTHVVDGRGGSCALARVLFFSNGRFWAGSVLGRRQQRLGTRKNISRQSVRGKFARPLPFLEAGAKLEPAGMSNSSAVNGKAHRRKVLCLRCRRGRFF